MDNLVAGFALGASSMPLGLTAGVMGAAGASTAFVGLWAGHVVRTGLHVRTEKLGGLILVGVGAAVCTRLLG
jgi:putative Mn2+ efflux pump MntP